MKFTCENVCYSLAFLHTVKCTLFFEDLLSSRFLLAASHPSIIHSVQHMEESYVFIGFYVCLDKQVSQVQVEIPLR